MMRRICAECSKLFLRMHEPSRQVKLRAGAQVRLIMLTSGKAAPFAILETPSTNGLKYVAATLGSRTSLTRLSITTTVLRCTSILRSFNARMRRGTSTARAGDVTSATKVVDESALIQAGTESESDIHLTRTGIWGARSGLATVVQRDVAHLTAAEETY